MRSKNMKKKIVAFKDRWLDEGWRKIEESVKCEIFWALVTKMAVAVDDFKDVLFIFIKFIWWEIIDAGI